jgi:hypothetical protein
MDADFDRLKTHSTRPGSSKSWRSLALFGFRARWTEYIESRVGAGRARLRFDRPKRYFTTPEIVEMLAVVSLFGWPNRLSDTLLTEIGGCPVNFAKKTRSPKVGGWIWQNTRRATPLSRSRLQGLHVFPLAPKQNADATGP